MSIRVKTVGVRYARRFDLSRQSRIGRLRNNIELEVSMWADIGEPRLVVPGHEDKQAGPEPVTLVGEEDMKAVAAAIDELFSMAKEQVRAQYLAALGRGADDDNDDSDDDE